MNLVRKVRAAEKNQVAKWKTKKSGFSLKDKKCTMQHAFDFVPHECCTARARVAGVRLFNVLSAAIWFVGGREPPGSRSALLSWPTGALARGRFGIVAGARDEPF